ncbi:hypothetical protein [Nonomuraea sp. NPDC003804]|uniref:hypothetical protein n=1 Tax=Nonomuraea sp. NPDC003804 TaxID=3154547 RepID=UPI0033A6D02E
MTRVLLAAALLAAGLTSGNGGAVASSAMACTGDAAVGDPFDGPGAVHLISNGKVVPLKPPALQENDGFGWSVALGEVDGDGCTDLLVGAPYTDVEGLADAGVAYLLSRGTWKTLVSPEPQADAHFGWSVAAKGALIAVGAPYEDTGDLADTGSLYVGQGESTLRKIDQAPPEVPGSPEVGDQFGWALAFGKDNSLIVGAPYENDDGAGVQNGQGKLDSGSVVLIADVTAQKLSGVRWEPPDRKAGDRFGYAVAYAEGAGIAASAPQGGFVQLLDAAAKPVKKVTGTGAFGFSLAGSKDGRLAVGAPDEGGTGAVVILSAKDGTEERRVVSPRGGRFGWSVAFTGNRLLAGAPDAPPYGVAGLAGRNEDTVQVLAPPEGVEFGASAAG